MLTSLSEPNIIRRHTRWRSMASLTGVLLCLAIVSGCGSGTVAQEQTSDPNSLPTATRPVIEEPQPTLPAPAEEPLVPRATATEYSKRTSSGKSFSSAVDAPEKRLLYRALQAQTDAGSFRIHNTFRIAEREEVTIADVVLPGQIHYVIESRMYPEMHDVKEIIILDGVQYHLKRQIDRLYGWVEEEFTESNPLYIFALAYSFQEHPDEMVFLGTEQLDGMETAVFENVDGWKGFRETERVWITVDDGLLRKVERIQISFTGEGSDAVYDPGMSSTFLFYDYGADIRIEAPVQGDQ